jgi:carboxylesterase
MPLTLEKTPMTETSLASLFQDEQHKPFTLPGGRAAALLVHGFPGTPKEMRPLGHALNAAGWSVEGILLPGFGADIDTLYQRRFEEWGEAVETTLDRMKQTFDPVVLVGYSFGGAVSLQVAMYESPAALVLLAPFWKMFDSVWRVLSVVRYISPTIQPSRLFNLDFKDPKLLSTMGEFLPGLDLQDPQMQQAVIEYKIPIKLIEEVRKAGLAGYNAAPHITCPTLIVQGTQDTSVSVESTQKLIKHLNVPVSYHEFETGHKLVHPEEPTWDKIHQVILDYMQEVRANSAAIKSNQAEEAKNSN